MQIKQITEAAIYQEVWQQQDLHVLQSWAWGGVKSTEGWKLLRLGLFSDVDSQPLTVLSLQLKPLPFVGGTFAYVPKLANPLWSEGRNLKLLKSFLEAQAITFAILEFDQDLKLTLEVIEGSSLREYPGHVQPQQTNVIKLGRSEDELFMAMDGKYRRNIKKALRDGVLVTVSQYNAGAENELPLNKFYAVMEEIFRNTGLLERGRKYFHTVWELLGSEGHARIFTAELNGKVMGAYLTVTDNKSAYELYGGVTTAGREVEAGYLLKWEALKYFNSLGLHSYDNWGVAPRMADGSYDIKDELYQISRFKEGFDGEYIQFPGARALVVNKGKYRMFLQAQILNKLKTKFLKLFK